MRKHDSPKIITTDKLPSYGAAFDVDLLRSNIKQIKLSGASFIKIETLRKFFYVVNIL